MMLLASVLALVVTREAIRLTISQEFRDLLLEEATELELAVQQLYPDLEEIRAEFDRKIRGHRQHRWFAGLRNQQQESVWQSETSESIPEIVSAAGDDSSARFQFQQTTNTILVRHPIRLGNGETYSMVLGMPTQFIQRDVWRLTRVLLGIGAVLCLVAPLGGFLLARKATEPVREIIQTTRRLEPSNLQQRLQIRGTNDELDQISQEINSFLDQNAKYLQSHRDFIANAAHELRSPLTAIQTSVEVSLERERSAAEYRDELETVSEQCEQLRYLVNQLLELAESDAQQHHSKFAEFDLSASITKSLEFFSAIAEEASIRIDANLGSRIFLHGNEMKIRQVVNNLLDNALKFTSGGGLIQLDLRRSRDSVVLTVADTGCGIPEADLPRIFERFYQANPARTHASRSGSGLGLSICQSIIDRHGGKILVRNLSPHGVSVQVTWPA